MFFPDELDPDADELGDALVFGIYVIWKGKGRYAVQVFNDKWASQLSRAGNWSEYAPEPFRRHQYRFTYEEACEWAQRVVNDKRINGRTYAELMTLRRARN